MTTKSAKDIGVILEQRGVVGEADGLRTKEKPTLSKWLKNKGGSTIF